jgi:hypothetical protein
MSVDRMSLGSKDREEIESIRAGWAIDLSSIRQSNAQNGLLRPAI